MEIRNEAGKYFGGGFHDDTGSIGKRYRVDEIGTPYCITVALTPWATRPGYRGRQPRLEIRDRDTMEQVRIYLRAGRAT